AGWAATAEPRSNQPSLGNALRIACSGCTIVSGGSRGLVNGSRLLFLGAGLDSEGGGGRACRPSADAGIEQDAPQASAQAAGRRRGTHDFTNDKFRGSRLP